MAQYLGAGTAACYRGPYLYDESTEIGLRIKSIMKHWIQFYKMHRETLIQPVVHLRRPTVHGWDGWLHVHPFGEKEVGLAMIFNPTNRQFSAEEINLPLYYTALHSKVLIAVDDTTPFETLVKRDYSVTISLNMAPKSIHTIILERPSIASSGRKLAR